VKNGDSKNLQMIVLFIKWIFFISSNVRNSFAANSANNGICVNGRVKYTKNSV